MEKERVKDSFAAVVVAAGSGSRMKSCTKKQFMKLGGKPLVYYALKAFEDSPVNEIILVTEKNDFAYCRQEIIEKYKLTKVTKLAPGGSERYESVYNGLKMVESEYVMIQDGARPFLTKDIILRAMDGVQETKACAVAMPAKDTIKIVNENNIVIDTPLRSTVWQMQTPQCFLTDEIIAANEAMMKANAKGITDDCMIMEQFGFRKITLIEGSYKNIKVTTPEDLLIGENYLN